MKTITAITIAFISLGSSAIAQTTSFYGANGQYQGSATRNGNTTSYYGANGSYQGNAYSNGNTTSYYGGNGQYQGYRTNGGLR